MRDYFAKICVMIVLGMGGFQAITFSASPHSYWYSILSIILFSLEISCAYSLFTNPGKGVQTVLGWLFLVHGIYPLSMVFLSGLSGAGISNIIAFLFALFFIGAALLLLLLSPISVANLHGWRDRYFPLAFFLTYLPCVLIMGKIIGSGGPANEVGLILIIIFLLMLISIIWGKAIQFVAHIVALFAISYIVVYSVVISPKDGTFPVFLVFPIFFVLLYVGLTIRDKRCDAPE